tara:strand:- start:65 stop:1624 length:1560 start_codon:yes stop_codon:yes gene_type:complete
MIEKYLNNRIYILYVIPFTIGLLTVLSFQPFNLIFINFFILPIVFYVIVHIKKKSKSTYRKKPYKKNLFIFGTTFGFGFYLGGIHWITNSLTFDDNFKILIPIALIAIPAFLSLFYSITFLIVGPYLNFNLSSIFLFSSSLAISDYLRAKILTGFPWNLWSYSFSWSTEIIQVLNLVGLFTFNLISITLLVMPAVFFLKFKLKYKLGIILLIIFSFFSLYIYGNHSLNENNSQKKLNEDKFNIKIISPNFELKYGLSMQDIDMRLNKLIRYSEPKNNKETLFIWPEGVFSGYTFDEIKIFKKKFTQNFKKNHFILFGINRYDDEKKGVYNSMLVINNQLEIVGEYRKQKLVPFGEFLPLEKLLGIIGLKKITEGYGSFLKGSNQKNLIFENLNILPLICYEIIFTKFIQKSDPKTNLIVNISEDGWFGKSIGPHQHFTKASFRAIEKNSFLIRSANKGISAIINNKGEIIKKLNPYETGNIELEVPLLKNKNKNKNDLIFFILLITNIFIFKFNKKNND